MGVQELPAYADTKAIAGPSTKSQLEFEAPLRRSLLETKSNDVKDAERLSQLSLDEVGTGFLTGPFSKQEEVSKALGRSDWLATPRFLLLQGRKAKPRVIDERARTKKEPRHDKLAARCSRPAGLLSPCPSQHVPSDVPRILSRIWPTM